MSTPAKIVQDQEVTIINENGDRETGFKIFNPKVDKEGLISVEKDGQITRVHPKRIVSGEAMATTEAPAAVTEPKVTTTKPKTAPEKVNLASIATQGELWVKGNVEFDGKTDVQTLCLLFPAQNRYLSFNTYNGTFGKKGKMPPIDEVLAGAEVGYPAKDVEKLRQKLTNGGYAKFGEVAVDKPAVAAKPAKVKPTPADPSRPQPPRLPRLLNS